MLHMFTSVPAVNKFHAEQLPQINLKREAMETVNAIKKLLSSGGSESYSGGNKILSPSKYCPDYEPTKEEVDEYAVWLGMDLVKDQHFRWIAEQGLKRAMPPDWKACKTPDTGEIFYFNFKTSETTWDHPCDSIDKNLFLEAKKKEKK
tara:strand:+ start:860 stop:1303 length:444 start_codon:yes stop_codon:yes gene_type:complete